MRKVKISILFLIVFLSFDYTSYAERWINPIAEPLQTSTNGPFVKLADGTLATVDKSGFRKSTDGGKTWSEPVFICEGIKPEEPASYYLIRTRNNTLILIFLNFSSYKFEWDETKKEPKENCKLEVWSIRSIDEGKSWIDKQCILSGYNTNFFGLIQTRTGRVISAFDHITTNPGRFIVCSVFSDDEGKTWQKSNWIDLGGHGHHDGALEPTLAELSDGKILMLIRTNLDRLWQAISESDGKYWRTITPSDLDASSSPGYLLRLTSGRLVLVWNRLNPEGKNYPKSVMPQYTENPASWHREELSISISEDDGRTWLDPIVIAKQPNGQLSYPYLFEYAPGEIWIIAGFAFRKMWEDPEPFRIKIYEEKLLKKLKD
ncbi:MAG: glycoside hydrolase [Candidatus Hydrogenedentes bacterium]|nr:glycoside hydrolase [Candidatus Hydrogenedentota bacterium]